MITIYSSNVVGSASNCEYRDEHQIDLSGDSQTGAIDTISSAVRHDYVCVKYADGRRSNENFIMSNCLPFDVDNDFTDDPNLWIQPEKIANAFPGVQFGIHYSRNNMKAKNGKSARPKFHVFFEIDPCYDALEYAALKRRVHGMFPYFDSNALDAARFFFGTSDAHVDIHDGLLSLSDYLEGEEEDFDTDLNVGTYGEQPIVEGSRNSTMSLFAAKVLKRFGDTEEARKAFYERAKACVPPLPDEELSTIWQSALRFFRDKVATQPSYVEASVYGQDFSLRPTDFSDVGQATILSAEYKGRLRYSPATSYLVYNDSYWEESEPKAQAVAQELTGRQLDEAEAEIKKVTEELKQNGGWEIIETHGIKKAADHLQDGAQIRSFQKLNAAVAYKAYSIKRRDSRFIASALKESRPMVEVGQSELDADGFLLNTPSYTYDLRRPDFAPREHDPSDLITKQTQCDPSDEGADVWKQSLNTFFCEDNELIEYVQRIVGLAVIGKVYQEALIIAYGEGRNGKSTFWNTIARVLGSYSGALSADALTVGCKRNVKPEMAELRGKRMVIAAELEEGARLSTSIVKQLCSTDEVSAEKKYKDPFKYIPSHTMILYTNHLPKVGAIDAGTWRRLIVIPFNASIEDNKDVKNFTEFLFAKSGGAIMKWVMEGARKVIEDGFKIKPPAVVTAAVAKYRSDNDWLSHFLEDCCEVGEDRKGKSGAVYQAYRTYCAQSGDYTRSTTDFYSALLSAGYERHKTKEGVIILGLDVKSDKIC